MSDRGENGIFLLGIIGYAIIEVDGKYVMVEILLSVVPFVLVDTVFPCVYMKVTDTTSNIKKSFKFFDGDFCFLHTLELGCTRIHDRRICVTMDDQDQRTV